MTNIFTPFNGQANSLAQTLFLNPSGISLVAGSASYSGDIDAAATFDNVVFGQAAIQTAGILLTSGDGTPPTTNTLRIARGVGGAGGWRERCRQTS